MKPHWERFYRKQAEQALALGPYAAVQTVQGICADNRLSGADRLQHIRFFLNEIDVIVAQRKEA